MATDGEALFAEFVARRYRSLVSSAYLLLGDQGHAEDLVQSALYRTYRSWHKLRDQGAAESYTRTTMVRLAGRWHQRRWRGETPVGVLYDEGATADPLGSRAEAVDVWRLLGSLPAHHRTVLVLRFYDDLSEADCAAVLGCSVGTVKSRTSRALQALRTLTADSPKADAEEMRDG